MVNGLYALVSWPLKALERLSSSSHTDDRSYHARWHLSIRTLTNHSFIHRYPTTHRHGLAERGSNHRFLWLKDEPALPLSHSRPTLPANVLIYLNSGSVVADHTFSIMIFHGVACSQWRWYVIQMVGLEYCFEVMLWVVPRLVGRQGRGDEEVFGG